MAVSIHLKLVLVVTTIGVLGSVAGAPSRKSQTSTSFQTSSSSSSSSSAPLLTAPAILTPTSSENVRFSRLLKENAEVLRFTSLSNLAPELARAISKESKEKISNSIPENTVKFGRRVLDYDDTEVDESSQKIITRPEPGNEYVYIQPPGISTAQDRDVDATLTGINKKPVNHRIPVALLRQTNGNRVNINPVFPNAHYGEQPTGEIQNSFNQVVTEGRNRANSNAPVVQQEIANLEVTTTVPHYYNEEYEATTPAAVVSEPEEISATTIAQKPKRKKMVVNVVTSEPRVVFDNTTHTPLTTTTEAPTTTPSTTTTTSTKSSVPADEKENLLVQASTRSGKSFPDFEDSPTRLQTAESSQPARVNVRPASSGKDYEYEYIYYYYDDEDEDNSTKKATAAATPAGETTTTARLTTTIPTTTTSTTTTTTASSQPVYDSYEDEEDEHVEEKPIVQKAAPPLKNSFSSAPVPAKNQQYITEKITASNPSNLLEKTRGQKTFPSAVADSSEYKVDQDISKEEDDDEYEDQQDEPKRTILSSSLRGQNQGREIVSEAPVDTTTITATRPSTSGIYDNMPRLAKTHVSSVNTPIVLKASTLQRVPASQLLGATVDAPTIVTTTTTTTTTPEPEITSRASNKFRAQTIRLRGNAASPPGNSVSRAIPSTPVENSAVEQTEAPVRHRPSSSYKESTRRVASRRPHFGETTQQTPEAPQPQASPSITVHNEEGAPKSISNIRTRFPPRTTQASPVEAAPTQPASEVPYLSAEIISTSPAVDANSVNDKKAKENFVKNKSANDLYAFTRLQQAIHSRTPSRSKELQNYNTKATAPKVGGFLSSQEQTTDAPDSSGSSEATTVSSYLSGSSGESAYVVTEQPSPTTTTTTTTTTEAVQLDRFGKPKRFPGRTRRPNVGSATTTTTTEAPAISSPGGSRFNGRRRKFGTSTSSPDAVEGVQQSGSASPTISSEPPSVRAPARSRFANRNRGSTTEASTDVQHKEENGEQSTSAPQTTRARRPNHFQSRKRLNKPTQATTETEDESSVSVASPTSAPVATPAAATSAPTDRRRVNYANHGRNRPALTGGPGPRIRPGRLGGTTTTTEAPVADPSSEAAADNQETAEQTQAQGETEGAAPVQTTTAAPELPKRGSAGVLDGQNKREFAGRLRNRSRPLSTTTAAPEPVQAERKPSRVGGILNRRKQATATTPAAPAKEEVKEDAEEANNHAQEQVESQHKGVVVQISSSVSEGEEVQHVEEEPSSTTPGSILNRLKSQRKPGSIYRKRPEPHGEQ